MNFTVYLNDELAEKVNSRLRRDVKVSILCRWLLIGVVMTPKEIEAMCRESDEEARAVAPYLQEALQKLLEGGKAQEIINKKGEKSCKTMN